MSTINNLLIHQKTKLFKHPMSASLETESLVRLLGNLRQPWHKNQNSGLLLQGQAEADRQGALPSDETASGFRPMQQNPLQRKSCEGTGKNLDFMEVFPDEGSIDMIKALKAYQEVDYKYMLMPDHVPSISGPNKTGVAFSYCYGYITAGLQSINEPREMPWVRKG